MVDASYRDEWQDLSRRRRWYLLWWLGWVPGGALIAVALVLASRLLASLGFIVPEAAIAIVMFAVFFLWVFFLWLPAGRHLGAFSCPRCGERFGNKLVNLWRRRCPYCGLTR